VIDPADIVYRLRFRAKIRRQITDRDNDPSDRISDLLEEAADEIEVLREEKNEAETATTGA
jgi:hypothetical protein